MPQVLKYLVFEEDDYIIAPEHEFVSQHPGTAFFDSTVSFAMARAFGTLSANTLIANPGGNLIFSSGSFCAVTEVLSASAASSAQRRSHLIV